MTQEFGNFESGESKTNGGLECDEVDCSEIFGHKKINK